MRVFVSWARQLCLSVAAVTWAGSGRGFEEWLRLVKTDGTHPSAAVRKDLHLRERHKPRVQQHWVAPVP